MASRIRERLDSALDRFHDYTTHRYGMSDIDVALTVLALAVGMLFRSPWPLIVAMVAFTLFSFEQRK